MKKFFLLLCFAFLIMFAFSCSPNKEEITEVVFWHQYKGSQLEILNEQIQDFNKNYGARNNIYVKGVKVFSAKRIYKQLVSNADNELSLIKLPDIAMVYPDAAYKLYETNLISNFNPYLNEGDVDNYVSEFVDEGKIFGDENIYLLPIAKSSEVLYINKTAYDRFLLEYNEKNKQNPLSYAMLETFEGIMYSAQEYYEYTDGKALFGMDSPFNFVILAAYQNGVDIFSYDSLLDKDSKVYDIFFKYYYEPMIKGYYAAYSNYRADDLKSGDILMYTGSTGGASFFPKSVTYSDGLKENIELEVLPYPYLENGFELCIQQGPGIILLNSSKQKKQASTLFLNWLTCEQNNTQFILNSGYLPVNRASFDKQAKNINYENNISKVINVALKSFEHGSFYSYRPNQYSEDIRITLEIFMIEKMKKARENFLKYISEGHSFDQAVSYYFNADVFDEIVCEAMDEISKIYKK